MRVYIPTTLPGLARALKAGEVGPAPLEGYAVTPGLREWYAEGDGEEMEYAAMTRAAGSSLRLLGADPSAPPRRVVVAAEVPDGQVSVGHELGRALVRLDDSVPLAKVVSAHVDDELAGADVRAAVNALPAADGGDDGARFVVDGAEGHELMWYAAQELTDLTG